MTWAPLGRWDLEPALSDLRLERRRRQRDLALGYRLFGALRLGDLGDGHISCRDPEHPDCFWLLRYGVSYHAATVDDLVLVDGNGLVVEGEGSINVSAFHIHHPILEARPDVVSAAHVHSPWGTPLSAEVRIVEPITQEACYFFEDQALFDDEEVEVLNTDGGARIAKALGDNKVVILRNHGHLTVGPSVAESVAAFVTFERIAEAAMKAREARPIAPGSALVAKEALWRPGVMWQMFQWLLRRHIPDPDVVAPAD